VLLPLIVFAVFALFLRILWVDVEIVFSFFGVPTPSFDDNVGRRRPNDLQQDGRGVQFIVKIVLFKRWCRFARLATAVAAAFRTKAESLTSTHAATPTSSAKSRIMHRSNIILVRFHLARSLLVVLCVNFLHLIRNFLILVRNLPDGMHAVVATLALGNRHEEGLAANRTFATYRIRTECDVVRPVFETLLEVLWSDGAPFKVGLQRNRGRKCYFFGVRQTSVFERTEGYLAQPFIAPPASCCQDIKAKRVRSAPAVLQKSSCEMHSLIVKLTTIRHAVPKRTVALAAICNSKVI